MTTEVPAQHKKPVQVATVWQIAADFEALLVDAYGVLVDSAGPLAGAPDFIARARSADIALRLVTNDASRLETTIARRLAGFGIEFSPDEIMTSGALLRGYYATHQLSGARTIVLGPKDSEEYVRRAGGVVVEPSPTAVVDVIAVCDEDGYDFLETVDDVASALFAMVEAGSVPRLVMPNPDLIYPKNGGYGFTSGAATLLLEAGLRRRFPGSELCFDRLGKPHRRLFDRAVESVDGRRALAVGDQLETDIASATAAGLEAVLVTTGVSKWRGAGRQREPTPDFVAAALL